MSKFKNNIVRQATVKDACTDQEIAITVITTGLDGGDGSETIVTVQLSGNAGTIEIKPIKQGFAITANGDSEAATLREVFRCLTDEGLKEFAKF